MSFCHLVTTPETTNARVQFLVLVVRTLFLGNANRGTTEEPSKEIAEFEGICFKYIIAYNVYYVK